MVKVKMLVSLAGADVLSPGEMHQCTAEEAKRLVQAGFAEFVGNSVETATKPAPRAKRKG